MALDQYADTMRSRGLWEVTRKAILRSFLYLESKREGVNKLSAMKTKLSNPDFYNDALHPHCRLRYDGEELPSPWHNRQYDSIARLVIALARHTQMSKDTDLVQSCRGGLEVAMRYLFDAIWDRNAVVPGSPQNVLTVCANEWEEQEEQHLRSPLFSSVVGLLNAAARDYQDSLQQYIDPGDIDLRAFEKQTETMLREFFVQDGEIRMIKRFRESPRGMCATSLWLLTTYDTFPVNGEVFNRTVDSLRQNSSLSVQLESSRERRNAVRGLRRYELVTGADGQTDEMYVDRYWGGQAWIITTAQLATALAMRGDVEEAALLLEACLSVRDSRGRLPEQFDGTYLDRYQYERWRDMSQTTTAPPWLSWSHAEVLRTFVTLQQQELA